MQHEVAIASVFDEDHSYDKFFYSGRFDFVEYEVHPDRSHIPVLAIELDGKEHKSDKVVQARDRKKEEICRSHGFQLIRVENSYARRYHHIKDIFVAYFEGK